MYTCPLTRRAGLKGKKRREKKREDGGWEPRGAGLLNEPFRKNYVIGFVCVRFFNRLLPKLRIEKYSMGIMSETQ